MGITHPTGMFAGVLKKRNDTTAFTAAHVWVLRVVSGEDGNGPVQLFLAAFLSRVFSCRPSLTHTPTVPHLQRLSSNTVIFLQASQNSALCVTACLFCRKSKDVNKRPEHPALGWARLPRVRVNYWLELVYSYWKSVRENNADIL